MIILSVNKVNIASKHNNNITNIIRWNNPNYYIAIEMEAEWLANSYLSSNNASWYADKGIEGYVAPKTVMDEEYIGCMEH